jgi:hypothetical protein
MKKLIVLFFTTLLLLTNVSCLPQKDYKVDAGAYSPLPVQNRSYQGIDKPKLAWTYTWGYQGNEWVGNGIESSPVIDGNGNTYFIDSNNDLQSVSPTGKLQWKSEESRDKAQSYKNGIIINTFDDGTFRGRLFGNTEDKGLMLNVSGKNIQRFESYPYYGPDGFFYSFFRKKDDKKVIRDVLNREWNFRYDKISYLYSFDTNQKIRWIYQIPQTGEEYRTLEKCFFDKQGNIYFVITVTNPNRFNEIISLTSAGKFRWMKDFIPKTENTYDFYNRFIDFIPDQFIFNEVFLIRLSDISNYPSEKNEEINKFVCLSSDGEELWSKSIPDKLGLLSPYSINKDSVIYLTFTNWDLEKTYLQAISKTGKMLWEIELTGMESTSPILDKDGNIYLGVGGGYAGKKYCDRYLYSFTSTSQLRWKMLQPNPSQNYEYSLVLGPNRRIYYGCFGKNIVYCIENE